MEYLGRIYYINSGMGLGQIIKEGENIETYSFTFDKIENYKGEHLEELKRFSRKGLREGTLIKFTLNHNRQVSSVKPVVFVF